MTRINIFVAISFTACFIVGYFIRNETISIKFRSLTKNYSCTFSNDEVILLKFQQLFINSFTKLSAKFAVVVTEGVHLDRITNDLCPLIEILKQNEKVTTISGMTIMPWKPICTLERKDWTLRMLYKYSTFEDGSSEIFFQNIACYSCDLLPDIFVINLEHLKKHNDQMIFFKELKESAHLPFFLSLKGRSAYCPDVNLPNANLIQDVTCNNLSSRWDEKFALVAGTSKLMRLITENNEEAWLGCIWWKKAYTLNLPIHCSNFVLQYLFDMVDILEQKYKVDYRLNSGVVVGALRNKEILPWTVDIDTYINMPYVGFRFYDIWKLSNYSDRKYSYFSKVDNSDTPPFRGFPRCPVILTVEKERNEVYNATRNDLISKTLKENNGSVSYDSDWKSTGFMEFQTRESMLSNNCTKSVVDEEPYYIEIHKRMFKTFANPIETNQCFYGSLALPNASYSDWQSYF